MSIIEPEGTLPNDRELALHEIKSLAEQMRSANLHVYTKPAWRRDRLIGWFLTVLIISGLGWGLFYQYASAEDLRASLYQSCRDANARNQATRDLYDEIARGTKSPEFKLLLAKTSARLEPVDCQTRYLTR